MDQRDAIDLKTKQERPWRRIVYVASAIAVVGLVWVGWFLLANPY